MTRQGESVDEERVEGEVCSLLEAFSVPLRRLYLWHPAVNLSPRTALR